MIMFKQQKYKRQYDKGTALRSGQSSVISEKKTDLKSEPWMKGSVVAKEGAD